MRKIGFGVLALIGCIVLGSCAIKENLNESESEKYYSEEVDDSISKYPEFNTTEIVVDHSGWGPMIVSPYISDEEVRAVAHVIYETKMSTYCYHNYLYDKYADRFDALEFEEVYQIVQDRVKQCRKEATAFDERFAKELEEDSLINISPEGEYYYILDKNNFNESANAINASVKKHEEAYDYNMQFESEYYFVNEGKEFLGGYRGVKYSVYLDSYADENKVYEYYFWKSKNQNMDVYCELYEQLIYAFTVAEDTINDPTDNKYRLSCYYGDIYGGEPGLKRIHYELYYWSEDLEPSLAIKKAYDLYNGIKEGNAKFNTYNIRELVLHIRNFPASYGEYKRIDMIIPIEEDFTWDKFEKVLLDNIELDYESEPE